MSSPGLRTSLRILAELGNAQGPLSFSVLAAKTDTSNSTLSRLLGVLMEEGWVVKQDSGGYTCGPAYRASAETVVRNHRVPPRCKEAVKRVADETGQSACFITWEGTHFVIRHKVEMPDSYHFMVVGKPNRNVLVNGLGKLLLAHQSTAAIDRVAERNDISPAPRKKLLQDLAKLKKKGYCISDDRAFRIGIPVFEDGSVIGVLGISAARRDIAKSTQTQWRKALVEALRR